MKKRNLFLLPLLVLGSTGLTSLMTSCKDDSIVEPGPEEPGPEEPGPEEPVVVAPTSIAFAEDSLELRVGNSVYLPAVTVLPENATDKSFTVTNSNGAAVKLVKDGNNYGLEGVAPGEVVITVTSTANPELKDTILVTVPTPDPLPTPIVKTVAEVSAMTATDTEHLYEVTGIVSQISHDIYGNMYLSSSDGSASIKVYGVAPDASCFDWTDYNYTNIKFTNPKTFKDSGLSDAIDLGDEITLVCQFELYKDKNNKVTPEIYGYLKAGSIVKASARPVYSASVEVTKVGELGGATLSKTEGVCYGEELTVTVDAVTDYKPIVKVNDGFELTAKEDGTYKFIAGFTNKVTVEYAPSVNYTYTELEKFDFHSDLIAYEVYDAAKMDEFIKGSTTLEGGASATNYVSHEKTANCATDPLIGGNGTVNKVKWSDYNALKLGSTKSNCEMILKFTEGLKIGKVVVKAAGWNGKVCSLSINGSPAQVMTTAINPDTIANGSAYQEYVFTFTPSNQIVLSTTLAVMISEMVVYTAVPEAI